MLLRHIFICAATGPLLLSSPAAFAAEEPAPWEAPFPIPRPTLLDPQDEGQLDEAAAEALTASPDLGAAGRQSAEASLRAGAGRPIPVDVIRKGFSARSGMRETTPERSVGLRLGAESLSVSTTLTRPEGDAPGSDARIAWRAAHPLAGSDSNLIWNLSTGGSRSLNGSPEQTGNMVLGYRHRLLPHLTLTPQLAFDGNYVFVRSDGWHASATPELKLSADLAALADLPWETSFDVSLARKMPLVASDFETRGTAMLRLKYSWE